MLIKYLGPDCSKLLDLSGFPVVNEVGCKNCEGCRDNKDNLVVIYTDKYESKIKQWNKNENHKLC